MTECKEHSIAGSGENACREISDLAALPKNPLVSVKMITYNHAPYLAQAIEGVLAQATDFPIDLVIGEDCSTDGTRQIALDYQKKHPGVIRVLVSDRNVGMHENARRTENACRGRYIAICEGDDYWHDPRKLQTQVDFLEKNPGWGLICCNVDLLYAATGKRVTPADRRARRVRDDDEDLFFRILGGRHGIWTSTVCARKDLFDRALEADPEAFSGQFAMGDTPRWLGMARLAKFKFLNESMVTYRVLPNSASHSTDYSRQIRFQWSELTLRQYYMDKYACPLPVQERIMKEQYRALLRLAYRAKDAQLAQRAWDELRGIRGGWSLDGFLKYWCAQSLAVHRATRPLVLAWRAVKGMFYDL